MASGRGHRIHQDLRAGTESDEGGTEALGFVGADARNFEELSEGSGLGLDEGVQAGVGEDDEGRFAGLGSFRLAPGAEGVFERGLSRGELGLGSMEMDLRGLVSDDAEDFARERGAVAGAELRRGDAQGGARVRVSPSWVREAFFVVNHAAVGGGEGVLGVLDEAGADEAV